MVRLENVGLRYSLGEEALKDLSFDIEAGTFHVLTGPSGAGKTSLLKLLMLSLKPTRGYMSIFGRDVSSLARSDVAALRRRIGVVFQDFRLLGRLTTFQNVALPLLARGRLHRRYADDVAELISWIGLERRINTPVAALSGGEQQRAAIARAVVAKPELLLADEPTGNVDPEIAKRLLTLFVELNKGGAAVVIATHDPNLRDAVNAPTLELRKGRVVK